jgi:hypothetical protein
MTDIQVTERDIQSLAAKLETFSQGLSANERTALSALVRLATAASAAIEQPEVSGHMMVDPFTAALLAEAHHRELLADAEHTRMVNQARAAQSNNQRVWDRLRDHVAETADRLWVPHRQTQQPTSNA